MIEEAMVTRLTGWSGFSSIVGDRLFPVNLPADFELPAVVYQRIATLRELTHSGPSGLADPRFQFTIYAEDFTQSQNIRRAIRQAFHGFSGLMGEEGLRVGLSKVEAESDGWDHGLRLHAATMEVVFGHEEV